MEEEKVMDEISTVKIKARQNIYYIIIGIISFITVAFLPMVGSTVGLQWKLPDTTVGWIVWAVTRLVISTINVLLFYSFMEQAKLNVKDNERYKQANEILLKSKIKEHEPKSPSKWQAEQYGRKATKIFLGSAMSVVAFGQAILSYDWVSMLAYIFTLAMGLIFGVMQMKKAEIYWTTEYYAYALKKQESELEEKQEECLQSETKNLET